MSSKGLVYLVAIAENKPEDICQRLVEQGFAKARVVTARKAMNERLMIIRAENE